jgi:hypothetical protein
LIAIGKNLFLLISKMPNTVCTFVFIECNSASINKRKILTKFNMVIKNTEFDDDFKFAEMVFKNCS